MKEVTKESELKFLRKLEDYFEHISEKEIDQATGSILEGPKKPCGCFGAHIAKLFKKTQYCTMLPKVTNMLCYEYTDGMKIFEKNTNPETEDRFYLHGADPSNEDEPVEIDGIFAGQDWSAHPYEVIKKVIGELENEKSN